MPSFYDPIRNPQNNKARRDLILKQMLDQGYIDSAEYFEAVNTELTLNVFEVEGVDEFNSWYVDMVIEDVINDLMSVKGCTRSIANLLIYTGGLRIYTAMDYDIQLMLDEYYSNTLEIDSRYLNSFIADCEEARKMRAS